MKFPTSEMISCNAMYRASLRWSLHDGTMACGYNQNQSTLSLSLLAPGPQVRPLASAEKGQSDCHGSDEFVLLLPFCPLGPPLQPPLLPGGLSLLLPLPVGQVSLQWEKRGAH